MRCKRWDWKTGEKSAECVAQCGCCCCCCCCCAISVYYHHHFFPSWLTLQVTRSHSHSHSHTVSHFYDNAGMEDAAATKMPLLRPATILSLANWWLNGRKEGKKKEKNWQVNDNNIHSISPADTCCERVKSAHTHRHLHRYTGHRALFSSSLFSSSFSCCQKGRLWESRLCWGWLLWKSSVDVSRESIVIAVLLSAQVLSVSVHLVCVP